MESSLSFQHQKQIKTYGNPRKTASNSPLKSNNVKSNVVLIKRVALTTKKAIELLFSGKLKKNVCRFCLYMTYPLSELDQIMQIAGNGAMYKVTIRDIMGSVHPFKVVDDPNFPNKICERCINKAIHAYLFAQQCEQSERALRNCFDDVYEKLEKLDPLEKSKKRGRQKQHQNHNVIRVQHHQVIDYAEPIRNLINVSSISLTKEPQIGPLECKKCWQILPNIESLVNHEQIHPKSMWYHCRLCGKSYAKKYQINRHIKLHARGKLPNLLEKFSNDEETSFICKQCSHTSENYDVHLQHIEKHKFKMVLEHLVKRNMDKLCTVCFNKHGKMVEMDKLISLHGGYPELTGDRTLYNILGSTVPEPNYKYQELQIAQKAKLMIITRKVTKDVSAITKPVFDFSLPLIISAENDNNVESYLFLFSVPEHLQENEINTMNTNGQNIDINTNESEPSETTMPDIDFSYFVVDDINKSTEKPIEKIQNISNEYKDATKQFVFSKPDYNVTVEVAAKPEDKEINSNRTLCNICWIFNKTSCEKCVEENLEKSSKDSEIVDLKDENKTSDIEAKSCQYCWVFKHVDKCEYCNNKNFIATANNDKAANTATKERTDVKSKTTKRRIDFANAATPKKSKWQCKICLVVNNFDRETCMCCESKEKYNSTVKVDFGANKNKFLDFMNNTAIIKEIGHSTTDNVGIEMNKTQDVNRNEIKLSKLCVVESIEHPITKNMELSNTEEKTIPSEFVEPMDIVNEQEDSSVNLIMTSLQESKPFNAPVIEIQNNTPVTTPEAVSNPFSFGTTSKVSPFLQRLDTSTFPEVQFNIGWRDGPRKFKKPLRRIATTSHK